MSAQHDDDRSDDSDPPTAGTTPRPARVPRISLRVNPNVDAKTHPYIATGLKANKFGVAFDDALETYRTAAKLPHLDVSGIDCHIGSQLLDDAPLLEALDKLIELIDALGAEGIRLHHLDIGGGLGIDYGDGAPVPVGDYHLPHTIAWALAGVPRGNDARMAELLSPFNGHAFRVIRLVLAEGIEAPKRGPRQPFRLSAR